MPSFTDALESGNAFIHNYRRSNRQGYWIVTVKYHDQPGHKTFTNVGRSMLSKHLQQMNMDPLPEWKDAYDTVQPSKKRVATEKPKSEPKKKKSKKKHSATSKPSQGPEVSFPALPSNVTSDVASPLTDKSNASRRGMSYTLQLPYANESLSHSSSVTPTHPSLPFSSLLGRRDATYLDFGSQKCSSSPQADFAKMDHQVPFAQWTRQAAVDRRPANPSYHTEPGQTAYFTSFQQHAINQLQEIYRQRGNLWRSSWAQTAHPQSDPHYEHFMKTLAREGPSSQPFNESNFAPSGFGGSETSWTHQTSSPNHTDLRYLLNEDEEHGDARSSFEFSDFTSESTPILTPDALSYPNVTSAGQTLTDTYIFANGHEHSRDMHQYEQHANKASGETAAQPTIEPTSTDDELVDTAYHRSPTKQKSASLSRQISKSLQISDNPSGFREAMLEREGVILSRVLCSDIMSVALEIIPVDIGPGTGKRPLLRPMVKTELMWFANVPTSYVFKLQHMLRIRRISKPIQDDMVDDLAYFCTICGIDAQDDAEDQDRNVADQVDLESASDNISAPTVHIVWMSPQETTYHVNVMYKQDNGQVAFSLFNVSVEEMEQFQRLER